MVYCRGVVSVPGGVRGEGSAFFTTAAAASAFVELELGLFEGSMQGFVGEVEFEVPKQEKAAEDQEQYDWDCNANGKLRLVGET